MHKAADAVVHLSLGLEEPLLAVLKALTGEPAVRQYTKLPGGGGTRREGFGDGGRHLKHIN